MSGYQGPERRAARRWGPRDLPWPIACRVTPGREVLLVNLSAVGVLLESEHPFSPGRLVTVQLIRPSRRVALEGEVVRSFICSVDAAEGPSFRSAIAFSRWFEPLWELDSLGGEDPFGSSRHSGTV